VFENIPLQNECKRDFSKSIISYLSKTKKKRTNFLCLFCNKNQDRSFWIWTDFFLSYTDCYLLFCVTV
jgi:hypothetical protein